MTYSMYDTVANTGGLKWDTLISRWGDGTEFAAVSRVHFDEDNGMWTGFLVFQDERFSPSEPYMPGMQFPHYTPSAGNGACAEIRAEQTWETLVVIFKALMKGKG